MIYNQWYAVLESREVQANKPILVTRLGEKLVFWRDTQGELCCIADSCCHRGASLGLGEVVHDHLACPFHGFEYDKTGRVQVIPANGKATPVPDRFRVNSYVVQEKNGLVWLWWGDVHDEYPAIEFFPELESGFSYMTVIDHWSVHYSRVIENQLDVVHLPFVHDTTIGRGNKTLVHGPIVQLEGNMLRFFVHNTVDTGQPVGESSFPEKMPELRFRFPNTWLNIVGEKVRIFAAFVPIDDENTRIYIRFYHRISRLPVIRELISWMGIVGSKIILNQDKRVVLTQLPKRSSLRMGEQLVAGDRPIVEYRKRRDALIQEGGKSINAN